MSQGVYPPRPILLVDDEPHALASFDIALKSKGITNTIRCQESRKVMEVVERQAVELILLDLMMPHVSGEELLARLNENHPEIPVIVVTGVNDIDTAVRCMQQGAFDYVLKPVDADRLLPSVNRALEVRRLRRENSRLATSLFDESLAHPEAFEGIITNHPKMRAVFKYCEAIAEGQQPVLITGETGVGKEHIAQVLHRLSGRKGSFVTVNVAGLDDHVFSDTLFGHVKGAFTGADRLRQGLVEKAGGGTLFLDEIGDLSPASQVKLLRFLENGEYYPLGSDTPKRSDARVLLATHKDLEAMHREGLFRKDLYYRLKTHHVHLPPLKERKEDIPLLLDHFLAQAAREFGKKKPTYPPELLPLLKSYHFPGNIRELKAMVFDAVSSHSGRMLSCKVFRKAIGSAGPQAAKTAASDSGLDDQGFWISGLDQLPTIKEATQALIQEALRRSENNQRLAAHMLGITPQALSQRLKRLSS